MKCNFTLAFNYAQALFTRKLIKHDNESTQTTHVIYFEEPVFDMFYLVLPTTAGVYSPLELGKPFTLWHKSLLLDGMQQKSASVFPPPQICTQHCRTQAFCLHLLGCAVCCQEPNDSTRDCSLQLIIIN